jgi:hypothetical protein
MEGTIDDAVEGILRKGRALVVTESTPYTEYICSDYSGKVLAVEEGVTCKSRYPYEEVGQELAALGREALPTLLQKLRECKERVYQTRLRGERVNVQWEEGVWTVPDYCWQFPSIVMALGELVVPEDEEVVNELKSSISFSALLKQGIFRIYSGHWGYASRDSRLLRTTLHKINARTGHCPPTLQDSCA